MSWNIRKVSFSFIVKIILEDLGRALENKDRILTTYLYEEIASWMDWVCDDDIATDDKEIILEDIHTSLGDMAIWTHDTTEQSEIITMIGNYFNRYYGDDDSVSYFSALVIDNYKKKLITNWDSI